MSSSEATQTPNPPEVEVLRIHVAWSLGHVYNILLCHMDGRVFSAFSKPTLEAVKTWLGHEIPDGCLNRKSPRWKKKTETHQKQI